MWITSQKKSKAFTLIELLVVIAIIGVLSTVGMISLGSVRRKARDTKRVSDIQQVRNALLIYSNQRAVYPDGTSLIIGGTGAKCIDDSDEGFKNEGCGGDGRIVIMQRIAGEAQPDHASYLYTKDESNNDYTITFSLEGAVGDLSGGACSANSNEITCVGL